MFVSPAYAATGGAGGGWESFIPLILIFVVFYFLLIRPQQKKVKEHRAMVSALRRGDKVVTSGGIIGTISRVVDDNEVLLEVAENVRVRVLRGTISEVLTKPEPVKSGGDKDKGAKD